MKGKLDRVDSDGECAVVVEYKTGSKTLMGNDLLSGGGIQLLAYLQAVARERKLKPGGAYYLLLKKKPILKWS